MWLHLKKFKIWLQCETYTLLCKQRTNNKRKPLRDTDGKVVHKLVELALQQKYDTILSDVQGRQFILYGNAWNSIYL